MKYLAAYALLSLSGKKDINAADLKKVLGSSNVNITEDELKRLAETLKGKDINKLIASGLSKIGGGPVASGKAESKPKAQQKKKQQPKKKEQPPKKKEQPKQQEEDFGLGGGLFD